MANEQERVLIDIEVQADDANRVISQAQQALIGLKEQQRALDKAYKDGALTRQEYVKAMGDIRTQQVQWRQELTAGNKALQQAVKEQRSAEGSLEQLRAKLAAATKSYDQLSRAEREGGAGKELLNHIKELNGELMNAEAESGRFQRNVGNYPKVFDLSSTSMGKFGAMLQSLTKASGRGGLIGAMQGAGQAVKAFGMQLLKLLANPIVLIITAIVAAVKALVDAFKRNDDAMTALQSAMAAFKPIGDMFKAVLENIVKSITRVIEGLSKIVQAVMKLIPAFRDAAAAEEDLVRSTDRLQDVERDYTVNHARRQKEITRLAEQRADTEKYGARERMRMLQEESDLREEDMRQAKEIAQERLRLASERARLDHDTSDETKNNLAQLQAAVFQAESEYNAGMRRLSAQRAQLIKENKADLAARVKAEREAVRALEDARINAMAEGVDKETAQQRVATRRAIEALQERLESEKNLTAAAREALQAQIAILTEEGEKALLAIRVKYMAIEQQKRAEAEAARQKSEAEALAKAKELAELRWKNAIAAEERGSMAYYDKVVEYRRAQLLTLRQEEGEAAEEFYARQLAARAAYNDAVSELVNAEAESERAKVQATADVLGGLQSIMEAYGKENKDMAAASKMIALAQIAIETGIAIAKGVAQAQSVPFPANLAAIASTITAVMTNIATAISSVKSATFATGGYVRGAGTATSDSISARLSNGESVLTAKATSMFYPLLSAMNVAGGGVAFPGTGGQAFASGGVATAGAATDMETLRSALRDAVRGVQPVVSVKEITEVTNRVKVKELITKQ